MAERRMFAKTIIDSDAFLDMPLSAQALYFHLSMRADDDGFINNPKKIQRIVGASDDDCKLLIMKRFIITFESGVIVIKHWKIHNYIQKDRYKPTVYQEEKALLAEKENKVYTEAETLGIPNVYIMDTQVSIGKDSIDKYNIIKEKEKKEKNESQGDSTAPQEIVDLYNSICISFPSVRTLSDARKKTIKARLKTFTLDDFKELFEKAESSSFLKGDNPRKWKATFDWLIKDANMAKVLDGNYDNQRDSNSSFDLDELFEAAINRSYSEEEQMKPKTVADDPELMDRANKLKEELQG